MGSGAKSYMRKGFLIYEEMYKYFPIYEEAVSHTYMTLHLIPQTFFIYEENCVFFFISVQSTHPFAIGCINVRGRKPLCSTLQPTSVV